MIRGRRPEKVRERGAYKKRTTTNCHVSDSELKAVTDAAAVAGMFRGAYMRTVALDQELNVVGAEHCREEIIGQLRKLDGLIDMMLSNPDLDEGTRDELEIIDCIRRNW